MPAISGDTLEGVSATTLWTLHNRATEAKRSDGVIRDPLAVALFDAIDYDYHKFGKPNQMHALRALAFDAAARACLTAHPLRWSRWPRACRPASGGWTGPAWSTK
jgi:O-methyltransferase involved in polyketide biosynthesis